MPPAPGRLSDHGLLAPGLGQRQAKRARQHVDRAAGRIGHEDVDRLARIIVAGLRAAAREQQAGAEHQSADLRIQTQHSPALPGAFASVR